MRKISSWIIFGLLLSSAAFAQAARRAEYGANLNLAIYQFNDVSSKETRDVLPMRQTAPTAEEEIEYLTRSFGLDELKLRHVEKGRGNFVFFDTGGSLADFAAAMRSAGYQVGRPFPPYPSFCRVSMGTVPQMRGFAEALRAYFT